MAKRVLQWLLIGTMFIILTACGGGGGSDSNKTTQAITNTQNQKQITGYVVDDPVVGATIEVYDTNGTLLVREENATDSSGKFSINIDKDKIKSSYLKLKAYREDKDGVLLSYINSDDSSDVYVTQYTTALINYLIAEEKNSAKEYFNLANKVGLENGTITETSTYLGQKIEYLASSIEKAFKNREVYFALSDSTLTPKEKSLNAGSIIDFSIEGYKSLICKDNPYIKIENNTLEIANDLNSSTTVNCIAKNDNKTDFYSFNLLPNNSNILKIPANKKIVNYANTQILKPSDDEIEIQESQDSSIVVKKNDKVFVGENLFNFYPDGKVLKEPLTLKIPSMDSNKTFYLLSKDGTIEDVKATYDNGYYYAKIPHFSKFGVRGELTTTTQQSSNKLNYEKVLQNILEKDKSHYVIKADISYPNVLLKHGYSESVDKLAYSSCEILVASNPIAGAACIAKLKEMDLKDNIDVKGLLALLVLKNGKGMIDFDGTKINFKDGGISFDISSQEEVNNEDEYKDIKLLGSLLIKLLQFGIETTNAIFTESETDKLNVKNIKNKQEIFNKTITDIYDELKKNPAKINEKINKLDIKYLDADSNPEYKLKKIEELYKLSKDSSLGRPSGNIKKVKDELEELGFTAKNGHRLKYKGKLFTKRKIIELLEKEIEQSKSMIEQLDKQGKYIKVENNTKKVIKDLYEQFKKNPNLDVEDIKKTLKNNNFDIEKSKLKIGWKTNVSENLKRGFTIASIAFKAWNISLDYNFKQIDDKVQFLSKLKVYFPEYKDDINALIKQLYTARTFNAPILKQLYTYIDNATGSFMDMVDLSNDIFGVATVFSKTLTKKFGEKSIGVAGSLLSIANSIGQAHKTWSGANSLAYMSATASTLAYKMYYNTNLSAKERVYWYALFQTLSNASLTSWYYYDGKMAEKGYSDGDGDPEKKGINWMYVLGNTIDVGLSVASNPTALGLADGAAKAILNEQIVSTLWSISHGINSFRSEYNEEDEEIAWYLMQNSQYKFILNGVFDRGFNNKKALALPVGDILKLPNGNRVLSFYLNKGNLSTMSIRFDRENSDTYKYDLINHKSTLAGATWWNFKGGKYSSKGNDESEKGKRNIFGAVLDPKEPGIVNIVVGKNIKRIEILGWNRTDTHTTAYENILDLDNNFTTKEVEQNRIDKIVNNLRNAIDFSLKDNKNIQYLKNDNFTIIDLSSNKDISSLPVKDIAKIANWIAIKYYNKSQYSVSVLKVQNKMAYYVKDYLFDKTINTFDEILNTDKEENKIDTKKLLTLKYPFNMLEETLNNVRGAFAASYIDELFPHLKSIIDKIHKKVSVYNVSLKILSKNGEDITQNYMDEETNEIIVNNDFDKEVKEIILNIETLSDIPFYINKKELDEFKNISYTKNKSNDKNIYTITITPKFAKNNSAILLSYLENNHNQTIKEYRFITDYPRPIIKYFGVSNMDSCTNNGKCEFITQAEGIITKYTLQINGKTVNKKECKNSYCPLDYKFSYNLNTDLNNEIRVEVCNSVDYACSSRVLNISSKNAKLLEAVNKYNYENKTFNNLQEVESYYTNKLFEELDECSEYIKSNKELPQYCKEHFAINGKSIVIKPKYKATADADKDGIPNAVDFLIASVDKKDTDGDGISDYDEIFKYRYKNKLILDPNSKTGGIWYNDYIFSDSIIAAIMDNRIKNYPYAKESDLLKLKIGGDYDKDGLTDEYEFYYNYKEFLNRPDTKLALMKLLEDNKALSQNFNFKGWYKGLNPFSKDTDGDGFSDYDELHQQVEYKGKTYKIEGADPLKNNLNDDFDQDGLSNKIELAIGSNPGVEDTDNNGLDDKEEYELSLKYKGKLNISVANDADDLFIDSDKDNILNICEIKPDGQYWSSHLNKSVNCKKYQNFATNPFSKDTDGDKLPDYYEKIYNLPLPNIISLNPNTSMQKNKFNPTVNDAYQDYDNDGLPNIIEYKYGYYPLSFNSVMNAQTNIADGFVYKYNLENNASSDDIDNDGFTIEEEYLNDTDPLISYAKLQNLGNLPFKAISIGAKYKYLNNKIILADYISNNLKVSIYDINKRKSFKIDTNVSTFEDEQNRYKIVNIYESNNSIFIALKGIYSKKIVRVNFSNNKYIFKGESKVIGEKTNSVDRKNLVSFYIEDMKENSIPQNKFINIIKEKNDKAIIVNTLKKQTPLIKLKDDNQLITYKFLSNNILIDSNQNLLKIVYTLDKNGTPYYLIHKFWEEDANNNGIKDKYEYNNTRYEYVNKKDILALDSDKDGISDIDEINKYKTNPLLQDSDGDGLNDGKEIKIGTNPLLADSDGDGLSDSYEITHKTKKRLVVVDLSLYKIETTMDDKKIPVVDKSFLSYVKSFAEGTNSKPAEYSSVSHFEWSNDGEGNITAKFKPTGKVYHFKYKAIPTDPLKYDTDGDGMGDGYEIAYHLDASNANDKSYSPAMMLIRGKMIKNYNGDQTTPLYLIKPQTQKTNLQNYHDKQNPLFSTYDPYTTDSDNDSLSDAAEYFWKLNPKDPTDANKDSDNDGLTNKEEILYADSYVNGLDPYNSDTDGDGLPDGWEVKHNSNPFISNANDKVSGKDYTYGELYRGKVKLTATNISGTVPPALNISFNVSVIGATPPYKYEIFFGDGTSKSGKWETEGNYIIEHSYVKASSKATINIVDKNGKQFQNALALNINKNNAPIINLFDINTKSGFAPLNATFNYSVKDKENDSYDCYFTIDNIVIEQSKDDNCKIGKFSYIFNKPGVFNVKLHAKDQYNNENNQTIIVKVNKKLVKLIVDNLSGYAPQEVNFKIEGVDDNNIKSIDWDFGDGTNINNNTTNLSHDYTSVGNFKVKVKINYLNGTNDTLEQEINIYGDDIIVNSNIINLPTFENMQGTKISFNGYQYSLENGGLIIKKDNTIVGELIYDNYKTPASDDISLSSSNDVLIYINKNNPKILYALSAYAIKVIDIQEKDKPKLVGGIILKNLDDFPYSYLLSASFYKNTLVVIRKGIESEDEGKKIKSLYFNLESINNEWKEDDILNKNNYLLEDNHDTAYAQISFLNDNTSVVGLLYSVYDENYNSSYKSKICKIENKQITSICSNYRNDYLKKIKSNNEYIFAVYGKYIDVYDKDLNLKYTITKKGSSNEYYYNFYDVIVNNNFLKVLNRDCHDVPCREGIADYFKINSNNYNIVIPIENKKAIIVDKNDILKLDGKIRGIKLIDNYLLLIGTTLKDYVYENEGGKTIKTKRLFGPTYEKYSILSNTSSIITSENKKFYDYGKPIIFDINNTAVCTFDYESGNYPLKLLELDKNKTTELYKFSEEEPKISYDNNKFMYIKDHYHNLKQYNIITNTIRDIDLSSSYMDDVYIAYSTNVPYVYNNYAFITFDNSIYIYDYDKYSKIDEKIKIKKQYENINGDIIYINNNFIVTDNGIAFIDKIESEESQSTFIRFNKNFKDLKVISNFIFGLTDNEFLIYKIDITNKIINKVYSINIPNYIGKRVFEVDPKSKQIFIGGNGYLIRMHYSF